MVIDEEVNRFGFGFCGNMEPTCHIEGGGSLYVAFRYAIHYTLLIS